MKKLLTAAVILLILLTAGFIWWKQGVAPVDASDKTHKIFVIDKGEGVREIANKLKREGLIKDPVVFFLLVKKTGLDGKIQAGDFRLSPSMSTYDIAQNLTHGTLDIWVTVKEGVRADEIADLLKTNVPSFNESWRAQLNQNDGYLFPDTYLIPRDATVNLVINLMKQNFEKKFSAIQIEPSTGLSRNGVVILASLIEREAKFDEDRPLVASVIINRLNLGMALQIDATVQYALGYQPEEHNWWKKNLTADDIKLTSPYNTYQNTGLPIAPISNPGFSALQAAANPAKTNYLYYVSDKSGHNHYAKTLEEHNANIKKYGL